MDGLYILGNDVVFDQVIALINSIQVHNGDRYPICIIPYNDQVERLQTAIDAYDGVSILADIPLIQRWEKFATDAWDQVPFRYEFWKKGGTTSGVHRMGMHRRFVLLDSEAPFSRGIYLDADITVLSSLEPIFERLETCDFVTYDFQYLDPSHVFNVDREETHQFLAQKDYGKRLFCAGMFAAKAGIINDEDLGKVINSLKQDGGALLYPPAPDQTLLNYMAIVLDFDYVNLAFEIPPEQRTGCCVTSKHFEERDWKLYDEGKPLTYLHYVGLGSQLFEQVCSGENLDFPYRDLFLHYRYLKSPGDRPAFRGKPMPYNAPPSLLTRVKAKLKQKLKR